MEDYTGEVPTRGATVRVSFLFLVTFLSFLSKKKRKKVTKRFEIKEEF
jgi:hypothetical protein